MLAIGVCANLSDDKVGIGELTTLERLNHFCDTVNDLLAEKHLRSPTNQSIKSILARSNRCSFLGMFDYIDCSKWRWKSCPTARQGEFRGKEKTTPLTLGVIADQSLWIWHLFFGIPGLMHDMNVLETSSLLDKTENENYHPPCEYHIDGVRRNKPY